MIQPVLLLLLLAARFSPVFGTEISVLEGTSVTLVCRFPSEKNYILYTTLSETSPCKRWSCCNPIAVTTIPTITQENKYRCITGVEMVNFTILNLQPADSGNYCCSAAISTGLNKPSEFYSLRVVKGHTGCNRDLLDGLEFLGNDIENHPITIQSASQCRQECTNIDKCQYFTFSWEETEMRNKCSLKASTGDLLNSRITIQRLQNATSGYSLKNCSGKDERPLNTTGDLTTPVAPETTCPTSTGPPSTKTSTTTPTTLLPTTTNAQSTTSPTTTTTGQSTTSPTTTTNGQSTSSPITTINGQSTTLAPTITNGQSTSSPTTTTNGQSLTSPPITTNGQSTTSQTTTINGQSPTSQTTTTNGQSTTSPTTTTKGQSTTSPTTTTNGQSTSSPITTINGQSTTSPSITTNGESTTSPPTSTSSGQLSSSNPTSTDRDPTSSPCCLSSPLHPYYLHYINKSKSWITAMEFCRSRGSKSNLVHITNQTVHADVTQLIANVELACGGVWIGLERSIFEWNAPWLWTSGDVDKVVKYSEWHSCFPLNPINYHCGKMVRVGNGELKWLDASCHQELPFICQDLR